MMFNCVSQPEIHSKQFEIFPIFGRGSPFIVFVRKSETFRFCPRGSLSNCFWGEGGEVCSKVFYKTQMCDFFFRQLSLRWLFYAVRHILSKQLSRLNHVVGTIRFSFLRGVSLAVIFGWIELLPAPTYTSSIFVRGHLLSVSSFRNIVQSLKTLYKNIQCLFVKRCNFWGTLKFNKICKTLCSKPMSGAGSLVVLDQ